MNIATGVPMPDNASPAEIHPALAAFLAGGDLGHAAVGSFLASLATPLKEPGALTFLWHGEADEVELLRWIHAGVDRLHLRRHGDSALWILRVPVKDAGRFEYKLRVVQHGHEHWILDPRNPDRAGDPFGENSVAMTWGYAPPEWSVERGAPKGSVQTFEVRSEVFGETRHEQMYLPANFDADRPYPLVVIHDGGDYVSYAALRHSLDNLIEEGAIPPLMAVLITARDRMSEYPKGRRHARYVTQELLPALQARFPISENPADRVLLGASLGAVASLATAFRFPGTFGGLILKSGSFVLSPERLRGRPHPVFARTHRLVQAIRRAPTPEGMRIFISTGELEGLADENRKLAEHLHARGVEVKFVSSWDGHHWHNWRDQLRSALTWVLTPGANQRE